jgi:hypothetical protein
MAGRSAPPPPVGGAAPRRNHPLALLVFALAYLAILGFVLAPEGFFLADPNPRLAERPEP